mmetsp:Transcript_60546/g.131204  ORF Transcript_60546/g.131204 Transcript_60546/m.131204 type:complete len:823 (-) Transcript_60546:106-2574(-)
MGRSTARQLGAELIEAAFAGQHSDVARLLEEKANVESVERNGYTAVSEAAVAGHTVTVGQLLRALADPNHAAQDGRTALHRAAFHGWVPVVRLLLDHGADPATPDVDGKLPADLTKRQELQSMLADFPAQRTRELIEDRCQKLAAMPQVDVDDEEAVALEPSPMSEPAAANAKAAPGKNCEPASALGKPRTSTTDKAKERTEVSKAQKEKRYKEALAELLGDGDSAAPIEAVEKRAAAKAVVRGSGEERLNGLYQACFVTPDRVEFEKVDDPTCQIVWTQWHQEWRAFISDFKLGSTLYRHGYRPNLKVDACHGLPTEGWQKWFGRDPLPKITLFMDGEPSAAEIRSAVVDPGLGGDIACDGVAPSTEVASPPKHSPKQPTEFIELHPRLEIVASDDRDSRRPGGRESLGAAPSVQLCLGGQRVVETAEGLFAEGEVLEPDQVHAGRESDDDAARRWLESLGDAPTVPAVWEAVLAAKTAAQDLYAEGRLADARQATTAALGALRRLVASQGSSTSVSSEMDAMAGKLHSNRSLLVMQQILAADSEVLSLGHDAAWRLVIADADEALQRDPSNFKASYRRGHALLQLGDFEEALKDATRVVEHYSHSGAPNPDAAELRERIQEALRKERGKWGDRGPARWNRAVGGTELVTEVSTKAVDMSIASWAGRRGVPGSLPWDTAPATNSMPSQAIPRCGPRAVPARSAGDVEKALLSTLRGDVEQQAAYVRDLPVAALGRFFSRAPPGPDLLAALVQALGRIAEEDKSKAGEVLDVLAKVPGVKTQAAMFDATERASLDQLVACLGPEFGVAWEPEAPSAQSWEEN